MLLILLFNKIVIKQIKNSIFSINVHCIIHFFLSDKHKSVKALPIVNTHLCLRIPCYLKKYMRIFTIRIIHTHNIANKL